MNSNSRFPCWTTWRHTIGGPSGNSAAVDGWGCARLHNDHKPSFLVDPGKNLFYCYGCGRGGDVIRFAELYHQVKFPQALALLRQWRGLAPLLHEATGFYRMQLHRHREAVAYLQQRGLRSPELIEHMRIGYAPGGCLRGWLTQLGYSFPALRQAGLGHRRRATTLTCTASSFRWKAISMAAASRLGTASPVFAGYQGWLVCMGASPVLSGSDSRRGSVRLRRVVAGRFSQRHLLAGKPSQCISVSATVRRHANRSISPSMRTATAAASTRHNGWHASSGSRA